MFYISKVASELVRELPETQKELIIGDKSLMMRTLSLIDDEHFSPQWELIFGFMCSNALCFSNILIGLCDLSTSSFIDYLRAHNDILLFFYKHFDSLTLCDVLAHLLMLQDGSTF